MFLSAYAHKSLSHIRDCVSLSIHEKGNVSSFFGCMKLLLQIVDTNKSIC